MPRALPAAILCLALAAPLRATDPVAPTYVQTRGPATLYVQADKVQGEQIEVRLSSELLLTLAVRGRPPLEVQPPGAVTKSPGWKATPVAPPQTVKQSDGTELWRQQFRLDPRQDGDLKLLIVPLLFKVDGKDGEAAWQEIAVRVTTQVKKADISELRDITGIEDDPPSWTWHRLLLWAGVGVVVLGLALGAWELRRQLARRAERLAPDQWALRELDRLAAQQLPQAGETERYHTVLCDIVRRYLEVRFHLPASQQTTVEFLETMRLAPQLSDGQQDLLRDFLERCDLAKFARVKPAPEECQAAADMARDFVRQTAVEKEETV